MIMFRSNTRYKVTYRSNERKNAALHSFIADYLGRGFSSHELLFSCRPAAGTFTFDTNSYKLEDVKEVSITTPNRIPHKLVAPPPPKRDLGWL